MHSSAFPAPLYFLLGVCGWLLVCFLLNALSGWPSLARFYRADGQFSGELLCFCSARLGATRYRSCLTMGADSRGMYLSVFFPFSLGAAPLFIPWEEITAVPTNGPIFRYTEMRLRQTPSIVLRVSEALGRELLSSKPAF